MPRPKESGALFLPIAIASLAVVCCAAPALLAGGLAGLTLAAALGLGGGIVGLIIVASATVMALRARRCRARSRSTQRRAP